jgi:DNA-binding HxlR family transcriptional regulator
MWKECPIATSLQLLGRRWTLTILRDVAFLPKVSFGQIRKGNPGLRQRTLSLRLRELSDLGLVRKVVPPENPRHPYYELTDKGREVWPILSALLEFGMRNLADTVFEDRTPRSLAEVYPNDADLLLGPMAEYARTAPGVRPAHAPSAPSRPSGRLSRGRSP